MAAQQLEGVFVAPKRFRRLKITIREYLAGVLPGLADRSVQRLAELTPTAWAAARR
jgi:hypothetical protein